MAGDKTGAWTDWYRDAIKPAEDRDVAGAQPGGPPGGAVASLEFLVPSNPVWH